MFVLAGGLSPFALSFAAAAFALSASAAAASSSLLSANRSSSSSPSPPPCLLPYSIGRTKAVSQQFGVRADSTQGHGREQGTAAGNVDGAHARGQRGPATRARARAGHILSTRRSLTLSRSVAARYSGEVAGAPPGSVQEACLLAKMRRVRERVSRGHRACQGALRGGKRACTCCARRTGWPSRVRAPGGPTGPTTPSAPALAMPATAPLPRGLPSPTRTSSHTHTWHRLPTRGECLQLGK